MTGTGAAPDVTAILQRVRCLRGRDVAVRELTGGLSNRTLRVTATDAGAPLDVVVRLPTAGSSGTAPFGSSPASEHRNAQAAAVAGVGPPVVEFVPPGGPLVVAHVDARALGPQEVRDDLARVAALCRRLHGGPRFEGDFDLPAVQQRYLRLVEQLGTWRPPGHADLAPVAARVVTSLVTALGTAWVPTVPCHNDLPGGNVLDDGSRLWLVDFEFAANNEPWFELGNVASGATLTSDQVEELVTAYDGKAGARHVARTRLWSTVCSWTWVLWASLQEAVGVVDHDHRPWAVEMHERARAELTSPELEQLLALADPALGDR